jgi:hypothetical protein
MRPLDPGGLEMAYVLEWAGILLVGLARNGAGFDSPWAPRSSEEVALPLTPHREVQKRLRSSTPVLRGDALVLVTALGKTQ